jgi:hypothetical protein
MSPICRMTNGRRSSLVPPASSAIGCPGWLWGDPTHPRRNCGKKFRPPPPAHRPGRRSRPIRPCGIPYPGRLRPPPPASGRPRLNRHPRARRRCHRRARRLHKPGNPTRRRLNPCPHSSRISNCSSVSQPPRLHRRNINLASFTPRTHRRNSAPRRLGLSCWGWSAS